MNDDTEWIEVFFCDEWAKFIRWIWSKMTKKKNINMDENILKINILQN